MGECLRFLTEVRRRKHSQYSTYYSRRVSNAIDRQTSHETWPVISTTWKSKKTPSLTSLAGLWQMADTTTHCLCSVILSWSEPSRACTIGCTSCTAFWLYWLIIMTEGAVALCKWRRLQLIPETYLKDPKDQIHPSPAREVRLEDNRPCFPDDILQGTQRALMVLAVILTLRHMSPSAFRSKQSPICPVAKRKPMNQDLSHFQRYHMMVSAAETKHRWSI